MKNEITPWIRLTRLGSCLLGLAGGADVFATGTDVTNLPPAAAAQIVFSRDIEPILEDNCIRCHGPQKTHSHFRLDNRLSALKGGDNGVDILPGDSANSPLIHYVSYQVEDMEMPPIGRGKQLTTNQVSLLRAWIDQGAVWAAAEPTNDVHGFISQIFGGTTVSGDRQKYQELNWQKAGIFGGEQFQVYQQTSPDNLWQANGHVLIPNDYEIDFSDDRSDLGFIHSGWQQYRKYYDNFGGYDPNLVPQNPELDQDLYLDIGKAWIDLGLTLPDWPRIVLGYEYDYRHGEEATTEWGAIGSNPGSGRNIAPAGENMDEGLHILKLSLDDEIAGVTVAEDFRAEFYHVNTGITNTIFNLTPQSVNNGTKWFQGANTIRLERKFTDWCLLSAGYLYSSLSANSSVSMDSPTLLEAAAIPNITLDRQSNVGNLNCLLGPFDGLLITAAVQAEWDNEHGFGAGDLDTEIPPPPYTLSTTPFIVSSLYDETFIQENLALRYSKIPFTGLYAEVRPEQDDINQYDQFAAPVNILNKAVFSQHTVSYNPSDDVRAGFDTSPWTAVSFSAHYRYYDDFTRFSSGPLIQPAQTAYPTFIVSDDTISHEAVAELVLHPMTQFKTTLSYQYQIDTYDMNTKPYVTGASVISPGGELTAARDHSHIVSINATLVPMPRLYLSALFSYQLSSLKTVVNTPPSVVPYQGETATVLANVTYVLNQKTDLFAGYFLSQADYGQNNLAAGLPLGIVYQEQTIQLALTHRFSQSLSARLEYRYSYYNEPSAGGAPDFRANSILGTMTFRF